MSKRPQHVPWQPVASLFRAWLPAAESREEDQADRADTPPVTSLAESVYLAGGRSSSDREAA